MVCMNDRVAVTPTDLVPVALTDPNNATVIVSGDITENRLRALAQRYYASIPAGVSTEALRTL